MPIKSWSLTTRERSTTTIAMPPRLDTWIGPAARPVPPLQRSAAASACFARRRRALPYWQLYVPDNVRARAAFGRHYLPLLSLRTLADRLEADRGKHMASARQSVERKPAPDRGIRAFAVVGRYERPPRRLPLRVERARSRARADLDPRPGRA